MRVLAFSDLDWMEGSGGVERSLAEVYPRLAAEHDIDVRLVVLSNAAGARHEQRDGIAIDRARRIALAALLGIQVDLSVDVWRRGAQIVREFRPDLIHANTLFYHTSLVAMALAKRFRIPLLLTLHVGSIDALPMHYRIPTQTYERTLGKALLAAAAHVICVSDDVRRYARRLGTPERKITVIPYGVDTVRFAPHEREEPAVPTALSVGRLIANKGPQYLIEAAAELSRRGYDFRLSFVGDGPMEQALRKRATRLEIADITTFHGRRTDVESFFAQADVFVRPSLTEGMSLALLEAMAAGLPVVVSDVSGVRQLIRDGQDGLIVPPGDIGELTAALERLLQDEALRAHLAANARQRALQYDWSRTAATNAAVMNRIVKGR